MTDCQHTETDSREGETWIDRNGYSHTVIHMVCSNRGCALYGKIVRVRVTGQDIPVIYMPPFVPHLPGRKP